MLRSSRDVARRAKEVWALQATRAGHGAAAAWREADLSKTYMLARPKDFGKTLEGTVEDPNLGR